MDSEDGSITFFRNISNDITSHKTVIFIVIAVETSNLRKGSFLCVYVFVCLSVCPFECLCVVFV
jgi:uncharacterized protein YqfB (UPF0267 family)